MKILNVSSTINPITGGGEAERTYQMCRFLTLSGIECKLLTLNKGLDKKRKDFLGPGKVIPLTCINKRFNIPIVRPSTIKELVSDSEIVHLMGHWSILNALVYFEIRKQNKPYVICPAGSLTIFGRSKWLKKIYNWVIGKKILINASACIAVTEKEINTFISYGVSSKSIKVIPNGIDETDFLSKDDLGFRKKFNLSERPFVLFVGRLNFIKGPDLLLDAFIEIKDIFPDLDLIFAGPDDGMLSQLQEMVSKKFVLERVYFLGYLGGSDKSNAYHSAKILVIPSRQEAMSIVVLESGICHKPVLLTDQCGFNQLSDFGGGWVVPASVDGLRKGLINILSDDDKVARASIEIRSLIEKEYLWSSILNSYLVLYKKLIN